MSASATPTLHLDQIRSLLSEKGYEVSETAANILTVREVNSGVAIQVVLESDILFFSLNCVSVPEASVTPEIMQKMLDAQNGISTSHFQLYRAEPGTVAVTLNNFCKLQSMGTDDEDDILACVQFLLIDVIAARRLLAELA